MAKQERGERGKGRGERPEAAEQRPKERAAAEPDRAVGHSDESPPRVQATPPAPPTWATVWQVPVLLLGVVLLGVGLVLSLPKKEKFNLDAALARVETMLRDGQLEAAGGALQTVAEHLEKAEGPAAAARFHLLRGDLRYQQAVVAGGRGREDHERVVADYETARKAGQTFDDVHIQRWSQTLAALGDDEAALAKLRELSPEAAGQRYRLIRQIIERRAQVLRPKLAEELGPLLAEFTEELSHVTSPQERRAEEVWSVGLRARLLLADNDPQRAIDFLLPKLQMLGAQGGDGDLAALMVPLAQAYWTTGDAPAAQKWFELANQKLAADPTDALRGDALVGLGKIALTIGEAARPALEFFAQASEGFAGTPCFVEALLGQGDALARLGAEPEAKEKFAEAVKYLREQTPWQREVEGPKVAEVVRGHYERAFGGGQYASALEYATLLKPLYEPDVPRELLEKLAACHQRLAEERKKQAQALSAASQGQASPPGGPAEALRQANQETSRFYEQAGDDYLRLSQLAEAQGDGPVAADALWQSAICYDEAQCWDKAIARYGDYMQLHPEDPRRESALRRLGLAYQASGQHEAAKEQFERLIERGRNSPDAYDSLVPLAQCYVALGDMESAKRTLRGVLENHPAIRPDSAQYRAALTELGKLHYRLGEFDEAIALLTQAVERYGYTDDPRNASMRFWLADAYRQSAAQIGPGGPASLSAARVAALQQERTHRLEEAQKLYSQVITELEGWPSYVLSDLEKLYHRNAYFYRADCAYDLGRYQQAIELYDVAARKWERDPASLVALVQIVNAYGELGMVQEAKAANRRAQDQQRRIPEDAFSDPNLPMSRRHWEEWLRWTEELKLFEPEGAPATGQQAAAGENQP